MDDETNLNDTSLNSFMISSMNSSLSASNHCVDINDYYYGKDYMTLTGVQAAFGFVYVSIFILGFMGNTSVIIKVVTNRKLQSARNIFLLNLMLSDLLLCFTSLPVQLVSVMLKRWIFGDVLCSLMYMCPPMSVIITSFSLAAIAIDKFIHIVDCTKAPITLWQAFSVVVLIWLFATLVNVPLMLSFTLHDGSVYLNHPSFQMHFCGEFCGEDAWASDVSQRTYGTVMMCVQFIVPMIIISFCYSRILSKVAKDMMVQNKQFSSSLSEVQRTDALTKRRRVNYILITMVAAFVASWFPVTLYNILNDYGQMPDFINEQPYLWPLVAHGIAMSTVIWNPLLFFWMTRSRRAQRRGIFHSFLVTTILTWNPFSSFFRKRRSAFSGSESNSRLNGITKGSRMSTNGSCSDFDSYAKVETTDSELLKKLSRSSLYANGTSVNSISPKRPISLPGIVTDNNSERTKPDAVPAPARTVGFPKNSKLKQIIYVKLGNSVHV